MKKIIALILVTFPLISAADEVTISFKGGELTCNWDTQETENTKLHTSDRDNQDAAENRMGLAHVVDKNNLESTCKLIRTLIGNG